jgi:hypothetical protein
LSLLSRFTHTSQIMRCRLIFQILLICVIFPTTTSRGQSISTENDYSELFDTLFRTASNSPDYVIARKSHLKTLKEFFEKERTESFKTIEIQEKKLGQLNSSLDSAIKSAEKQNSDRIVINSGNYPIALLIVIAGLIVLLIAIAVRGMNERKLYKEGKDSYENLVTELDLHKKNAIERERKLMRKVIDLQNQLEIKTNPDS